jgi:hypothetical protein
MGIELGGSALFGSDLDASFCELFQVAWLRVCVVFLLLKTVQDLKDECEWRVFDECDLIFDFNGV